MCGKPTLRFPDDAVEVVLFARVLREVFKGEHWDEVEPCARRAWKQIAPITGLGWDQVRETVQRTWRLH
jgi:hypothetical protein